jgi:hypothetical protein
VADTKTTDPDAASVLLALRDLSRSLCFDPRGPLALHNSLPAAIQNVTEQLKQP